MMYIIANARRKGGLSGSDNIYLHFIKHFPMTCKEINMLDIEFKPFFICYIYRILLGIYKALMDKARPYIVYSASDFLMDALPALIYKMRGSKWIAGFYLYSPKSNIPYVISQAISLPLIKLFADVVFVTNDSMKKGFKNTVSVHGGYEKELAFVSYAPKVYDAVFCGRIHHTKGVKELIKIWSVVVDNIPDATLSIIGDGDLGVEYLERLIAKEEWRTQKRLNIELLGYMGDERFDIYRKSKMFLYTSRNDHWSMSPVEAMACGCPVISFNLPVLEYIRPEGLMRVATEERFARSICESLYSGYYKKAGYDAERWSKSWEWKTQSGRIWEELCAYL